MWGFEGVEHEDTGNGVKFDAELAKLDDTYLVGKIKAKAHPFVEYFKFFKSNLRMRIQLPNTLFLHRLKLSNNLLCRIILRVQESFMLTMTN